MKAVFSVMLFNCLLINSLFSQALHQASLYDPGIRMMDQAQTLDEYLDAVHYLSLPKISFTLACKVLFRARLPSRELQD
jgi:hypothetical protein